jgi:hypothetical protein
VSPVKQDAYSELLIRRHQLHGGICHGIGCCHEHDIGGMDVPASDAVHLVAEPSGDRRLVVAKIGRETGEAVAQHMRCDIYQQITPAWRSSIHLSTGDDRHLTGSTGKHDIAAPRLRLGHQAGEVRQRPHRCTCLGASPANAGSRSISDHRRPSTSPRSHPLRIISLVASAPTLTSPRCTAEAQGSGLRHRIERRSKRPSKPYAAVA